MKENIENVDLKYYSPEYYSELRSVMEAAYPSMRGDLWTREELDTLHKKFPEGQVIITVNDQLAGCAFSIIANEAYLESPHTYNDVIDEGRFLRHNPDGEVLYGIDVFIHPDYRGLRLGRRMYDYRKELCEELNLKSVAFGGRMPNYHKYRDQMSPLEYIRKVNTREIEDPVLNFQLANDFRPVRILKDYLPGDSASHDHAVLMMWNNIFYERPAQKLTRNKTVVRLGLVQWQMRPYKSLEDLMEQVGYFLDTLAAYNSDFALLPEFFNAPLLYEYNHLAESTAIRKLAEHTGEITQRLSALAVSYNVNIIGGSMPEIQDGHLYNVGYLCHRDGSVDRYAKVHITPDEQRVWGMKGGNEIVTFDTDSGKIGILICYDVEFPELSRIMADRGMDILFVPFLTDTQNGFSRVRHCAQARAIENECYVAIAGSVGNLPKVHNMDIQFAQSMVLTPCDFAFPTDGVKAEATPNTEMITIADVDLDLLKELHEFGSVKNLKDRRLDLYELRRK